MSEIWAELVDRAPLDMNQSRMRLYKQCHRKYWFQYVENLVMDRPAQRLELGTAIHKVLADVQSGRSVEDSIKGGVSHLNSALSDTRHVGLAEERDQAIDVLERVIPAYFGHWDEDSTPWVSLGQEVSGRVEVGQNTGDFLVVRIDDLVIWRDHLWIIDHKSMAKMDTREVMKYGIDIQPKAYVYAASKILQKRVAGIIMNFLVKTKVPQFHREVFVFNNADLAQFQREWNETCGELRWRLKRTRDGEDPKTVFYKNETQCFSYGGKCWYYELCQDDTPAQRLIYITRKGDYVDDPRLLKAKKENVK